MQAINHRENIGSLINRDIWILVDKVRLGKRAYLPYQFMAVRHNTRTRSKTTVVLVSQHRNTDFIAREIRDFSD